MKPPGVRADTGPASWLPRLQAIERCSSDGSTCEYMAWLLVLPDRTAVTGRLARMAQEVTLWPSVDEVLTAFGADAVVDEAPDRHITGGDRVIEGHHRTGRRDT